MGWVVRVSQEMLRAQARAKAEAIDNGIDVSRFKLAARSGEGDPWRLRGIPVVGARGVGGAIPGSRPESTVMSSDGRT